MDSNSLDNLLYLSYQFEMPLFKKHSCVDSRAYIRGGIFPNAGEITILCKNKNRKFNMGYYSYLNKMEYEYTYCPLCGELLEKEE